jgi:dihydroorotate dehydrogenase subfamily 1
MDLSVNYVGLHLKNPLIAAAGPLTRDGKTMLRALEAGFGAVVTETIVNEVRQNIRPRLAKGPYGLGNVGLYSDFTLEEWQKEIAIVREAGGIVIANILAHTPSEMAYIAKVVEKYGANAIELGVAAPHGEGIEGLYSNPERLYGLAMAAVDAVSIPVTVKMSPNVSNLSVLAQAVKKAGVAGISAIDTVRSIIGVDIERRRTYLPTYGGYSGPAIKPIALAAVATIAQSVDLDISGIGGIENYRDVVEYILLGASTTQILSALVLQGYTIVGSILKDLQQWMSLQGVENLHQIQGSALSSLHSFEELHLEPYIASLEQDCRRPQCQICIQGCMYDAIDRVENHIKIDQDTCTGCGLCSSLCPDHCFSIGWKT